MIENLTRAHRANNVSKNARRRGFSLIEAMMALIVLAIVAVNMVAVVPSTLGFASESSIRIQAIGVGQDYLDMIRQYIKTNGEDTGLPAAPVVPIDTGSGYFSTSARPDIGDFLETPSCTARSLFSFDCTVTVSWSEHGVGHEIQVESYIASQAGF
jgi:prepilin-type N-terminal cleavage/methylation domain-containing protein